MFMGTSLAIHFRQSDIDRMLGGPFPETVDDRFEFPRAELCAGRGARAPPQARDLGDGRLDLPRCAGRSMPISIFPPISTGAMSKASRSYLFSGAMAREVTVDAGAVDPAAFGTAVARLTNGVLFKFPLPDVDDINILRAEFRCRRASTTRSGRWRHSSISPIPVRRQSLSRKSYDYDAMVAQFRT